MAEQVELQGTVLSTRRIRGEWGAASLDTGDGEARATGDIGHLSRGDDVVAVGRWVTSKWDRSGTGVPRPGADAGGADAGAAGDRGGYGPLSTAADRHAARCWGCRSSSAPRPLR